MKKTTVLDQAFDLLSNIPYLKKILKSLWLFHMISNPLICLLALIKSGPVSLTTPIAIKIIKGWLFGLVVFGYMFYLWDIRENVHNVNQNKSD